MPNTKKVKKIGPEMTRYFIGFSSKMPKIFPKYPQFSGDRADFRALIQSPIRACQSRLQSQSRQSRQSQEAEPS